MTASAFRRESALRILKAVRPSVIRGNASEIHMLEQVLSGAKTGNLCGVDAVPGRWMDLTAKAAVSLEKRTGAVVVMTGTTDVVAGPERVMKIMNGHPWMGRITGSGCMLDGIIGAFCALCAPVQREGSVRAQRGCSWMRRDAGGYNGSSCHGCVRPWPVRGTGCRKGNQDRRRNRKL